MSHRTWIAPAAVLAVLLLFVAVYLWQPGGIRVLELLSDGLYCIAAFLAAALSFVASSRFDRGLPQRRAWFLLGSGLALWAAAEFVWTYLQVGVGQEVPYPSAADIIWAIGFAPLILGLYLGHRSLGVRLSTRQRIVAVILYAALLALLAGYLLAPMRAGLPAGSWAEAFLGSYYLIGDLTLAFVASLSLAVLWGGLIGRPWLSITLGMLLFAVSDTAFSYAAWTGLYAVGRNWISGLIDVMYLGAYLALALGAYRQATFSLADVARIPASP
jgi:hypothetical protein